MKNDKPNVPVLKKYLTDPDFYAVKHDRFVAYQAPCHNPNCPERKKK